MITAVVLSAGFSERMGRPKALLDIEGRTFLEAICLNLARAGITDRLVVLGRDAESILSAWDRKDETVVINPSPRDGQISSLKCALRRLPVHWEPQAVMVCLVDMPLVRPETYSLLIQRWRSSQGSLVVPRFNGKRGHPLILDHRYFSETLLAPSDPGLHWVTNRHSAEMADVDVDDPAVVRDIDTPEDYKGVPR